MPSKVSINGNGASIAIEVLGYERPSAQDVSDANWLKCRVSTNLGQFIGNYDASFTTSDFTRFRDELRSVLTTMNGAAAFVTDEEALNCTIQLMRVGTAVVKGRAQAQGHVTAVLSFSFESDQSFLAETLLGLESVVQKFPLKK
jgi:hypothetical protein